MDVKTLYFTLRTPGDICLFVGSLHAKFIEKNLQKLGFTLTRDCGFDSLEKVIRCLEKYRKRQQEIPLDLPRYQEFWSKLESRIFRTLSRSRLTSLPIVCFDWLLD